MACVGRGNFASRQQMRNERSKLVDFLFHIFKADNRVNFFNQIKNNDYDCVIMSHDQFGKIPQSPDRC